MLIHDPDKEFNSEKLKEEQKKEQKLETKDNQRILLKKSFLDDKKCKKRIYII